MVEIVSGVLMGILILAMLMLLIMPVYWMIVDTYFFKIRYSSITGKSRIEYLTIKASSPQRAQKKARKFADGGCGAHEFIEFIGLY